VQACQHFLPWNTRFLKADFALFEVLQAGSQLDRIITGPLKEFGPNKIQLYESGLNIDFGRVLTDEALGQATASLASTRELCLTQNGAQGVRLELPAPHNRWSKWIFATVSRHAGDLEAAAWYQLDQSRHGLG
jgi:hypothetical protein